MPIRCRMYIRLQYNNMNIADTMRDDNSIFTGQEEDSSELLG